MITPTTPMAPRKPQAPVPGAKAKATAAPAAPQDDLTLGAAAYKNMVVLQVGYLVAAQERRKAAKDPDAVREAQAEVKAATEQLQLLWAAPDLPARARWKVKEGFDFNAFWKQQQSAMGELAPGFLADLGAPGAVDPEYRTVNGHDRAQAIINQLDRRRTVNDGYGKVTYDPNGLLEPSELPVRSFARYDAIINPDGHLGVDDLEATLDLLPPARAAELDRRIKALDREKLVGTFFKIAGAGAGVGMVGLMAFCCLINGGAAGLLGHLAGAAVTGGMLGLLAGAFGGLAWTLAGGPIQRYLLRKHVTNLLDEYAPAKGPGA